MERQRGGAKFRQTTTGAQLRRKREERGQVSFTPSNPILKIHPSHFTPSNYTPTLSPQILSLLSPLPNSTPSLFLQIQLLFSPQVIFSSNVAINFTPPLSPQISSLLFTFLQGPTVPLGYNQKFFSRDLDHYHTSQRPSTGTNFRRSRSTEWDREGQERRRGGGGGEGEGELGRRGEEGGRKEGMERSRGNIERGGGAFHMNTASR